MKNNDKLTYTVPEMAKALNIGKNKAYELELTAVVEEDLKGDIVQERDFRVRETNQIACDHAAIIVQAWLILKSRL